jgi:hypothetical protein
VPLEIPSAIPTNKIANIPKEREKRKGGRRRDAGGDG